MTRCHSVLGADVCGHAKTLRTILSITAVLALKVMFFLFCFILYKTVKQRIISLDEVRKSIFERLVTPEGRNTIALTWQVF